MNELDKHGDLPIDVTLPAGWSCGRRWEDDDKVLIISTPQGSVTVDLRQRNFALGIVMVHTSEKMRYSGHRWKRNLINDAMTALRKSL